jgi:hypothetical protein
LENLDDEMDVNTTWETIREIISITENLGYYVLKKYKPWFDQGMVKLLNQREQAILHWS